LVVFGEPSLKITKNMLMMFMYAFYLFWNIDPPFPLPHLFINFLNFLIVWHLSYLSQCVGLCMILSMPLMNFESFDLMDLRNNYMLQNSCLEEFETKLPFAFLIVVRRTLLVFRLYVVLSFQTCLRWWLK